MDKSKFIVIAAPSGSGKTSIVNKLIQEQNLNLSFSVSATSRKPRHNEVDGKNYFFLSNDEFMGKVKNNEFIEWEEVYEGSYYGTLISELENTNNKNLIFDIDVVGGLKIKKMFPSDTLTIFVKPPSINELENRLKKRKSEDLSSIKTRIKKAKEEILLLDKFDCVIENDNFNICYDKVLKTVNNFING